MQHYHQSWIEQSREQESWYLRLAAPAGGKVTGLHWVALALSTNQARPRLRHIEDWNTDKPKTSCKETGRGGFGKDGADSILSTERGATGRTCIISPFIDCGMGFSEQWETLIFLFFSFFFFSNLLKAHSIV